MRRRLKFLWWFIPLVVAFPLHAIRNYLEQNKLLNYKDLELIGGDTGTVKEHLLNGWYWDGLAFLPLLILFTYAAYGVIQVVGRVWRWAYAGRMNATNPKA
jgi:hypothetical protein